MQCRPPSRVIYQFKSAFGWQSGRLRLLADYDYWPTNRVQTITHTDSAAAIISRFSYQYDGNGNRTQQIEEQGGVTETTTYVYRALDNIDRLESFTVTDGVTTSTTDYTFEGYNRKTEQVTVDSVLTVDKTYVYDETNWLDTVTDAVSSAVITYTYDNNGNTTLKSDSSQPGQETVFTYDVANRLVQTEQDATLLGQYDYNASGMRVRHYGSERGDVEYYYDDGAVLEEYVAGAGGGLLAHYRYGDRLLSLDTGAETQYYHHDALGSTVNLTDGAGLTKVRYTLDPWGHIRSQLGESVNRQIFTGQEHDENTGLIYFGARYYDPDTGRFISQDSYLGEPGTPPSLHRYLYAYSNPTVFIDPDGNEPVSATIAVGAVVVTGVTATYAIVTEVPDGFDKPRYQLAGESAFKLGEKIWHSTKSIYRTTVEYYTAEDHSGASATTYPINEDPYQPLPGYGDTSQQEEVNRTEYLPTVMPPPRPAGFNDGVIKEELGPLIYPDQSGEIDKGPVLSKPHVIYIGDDGYIGLTNDFDRRTKEWAKADEPRAITPLYEDIPDRETARGVEQILIEKNRAEGVGPKQINSIDTKRTDDKAVRMRRKGSDWYKENSNE